MQRNNFPVVVQKSSILFFAIYLLYFCEFTIAETNRNGTFENPCFSPAHESESSPRTQTWKIVLKFFAIFILVAMSALFSGLTLGLMGLDKIGLQIVIDGGEKELASHAKKIQPFRENGNLLLCTLLLGNVSVNSLLSILMAGLTSGLVGFFVSTFLIVIFGEIIPQATCSRYALQIGGRVVPIVKVVLVCFYIFAKPLSMLLDYVLGDETGTIHSRLELMKLLEIHVEHGSLDVESGQVVEGALKFKDMLVSKVMTPINDCFMLPISGVLDFKTTREIFKNGFSRIPIYGTSRDFIEGIILAKDLIFANPADSTPIQNFMHVFGREVLAVFDDQKLGEVLAMFKKGQSHMAYVRTVNTSGPGDPFYEVVGLITLEDILEEILGEEIVDETDEFVDMEGKLKVSREREFDISKLSLLDDRLGRFENFNAEELKAITWFLLDRVPQFHISMKGFENLTEEKLSSIVQHSCVVDTHIHTDKLDHNSLDNSPGNYLYSRGEPASFCTLILRGKLQIIAGNEKFRCEAGPWSVLAADALVFPEGAYVPDFSAFVCPDNSNVKYIKISRSLMQGWLNPAASTELYTVNMGIKSPRLSDSEVAPATQASDEKDSLIPSQQLHKEKGPSQQSHKEKGVKDLPNLKHFDELKAESDFAFV